MASNHKDYVQWFEAHSRPLSLYARQWLDDHAACDIVQDAFAKLLAQRTRPENVRAWLFRTVRNAACNELRRRRTRTAHAPDIARRQPRWFQPRDGDRLDGELAQKTLAELALDDRELIVMRIWGEMTYEQIADVTGQSISTVHRKYAAALDALRRRMVSP